MPVLEILIPVFLIVLLGAVLARARFLGVGVLADLNRLVYRVGLPAFLFESVAQARFGGEAVGIAGIIIGATVVTGALGYGVAALRGLPWESFGTFVQAATRGNLAYVGLPVIALAAQHAGPAASEWRTLAPLAAGSVVLSTLLCGAPLAVILAWV